MLLYFCLNWGISPHDPQGADVPLANWPHGDEPAMIEPMAFILNHKFKKKYRKLFRQDPLSANLFLLLCELAGPDGKVIFPKDPEAIDQELASLMQARFEDPHGWQL
jgi:hypothetical protein